MGKESGPIGWYGMLEWHHSRGHSPRPKNDKPPEMLGGLVAVRVGPNGFEPSTSCV